ncbi:DnaJ_zf domain-containing protein [Prevotella herbatica]|uniref:DnaJ_zf domain-containing protein n=1 Tax=Prevotella herbatica TaxID=2801997 RepID=A0ABN6EGI4_9BACT|nr:hypothetical protein [Prevotella herbatica]BCS85015.1 DnaJ_zf domain-containing protein [Prevotella herbatica]
MKNILKLALLSMLVLIIHSCKDSSKNSYNTSNDIEEQELSEDTIADREEQPLAEKMVTCPGCNGKGVIELDPGSLMAPTVPCSACNGTGKVSESTANKIIQINQQFHQQSQQRVNPAELEYELEKAKTMLDQLIEERENCSSVTLLPSYDNLIMKQKERIYELENQLNAIAY